MEEKIKPFDWTFTTNYTGTMSGFKIEETNERIDMDKLKQRDKILFYHDLTLFEDELHDNGIAADSVKIVGHFMNNFSIICTGKLYLNTFLLFSVESYAQ